MKTKWIIIPMILMLFAPVLQISAKEIFRGDINEVYNANEKKVDGKFLKELISNIKNENKINDINIYFPCCKPLSKTKNTVKDECLDVSSMQKEILQRLMAESEGKFSVEKVHFKRSSPTESNFSCSRVISVTVNNSPQDNLRLRYLELADEMYRKCTENFPEPPVANCPQSCAKFDMCCEYKLNSCSVKREKEEVFKVLADRLECISDYNLKIADIAKEVSRSTKGVAPFNYDKTIIDTQVKRFRLGVQYLNLSLAKYGVAKNYIKDFPCDYSLPQPEDITDTVNALQDWALCDSLLGVDIAFHGLMKTINHTRDLHNYIRKRLSIDTIKGNFEYPIYISTPPAATQQQIDFAKKSKQASVQRIISKGFLDIPLESVGQE